MKIVAFSDLHRNVAVARAVVEAARDVDVVVGAGDFATRAMGAQDVFAVLRELVCPFVFVHGNHDDLSDMVAWEGAHSLHGTGVVIAGVPFFGVGGETPVTNAAPWNQGQAEADMAQLLTGCPEGAVLVTHAPPLGVCDAQPGEAHEGSAAILTCVERVQPKLVICGHIHAAWGMRGQVGQSAVANVGPKPVAFEV